MHHEWGRPYRGGGALPGAMRDSAFWTQTVPAVTCWFALNIIIGNLVSALPSLECHEALH